jgi:hypothetical protein
MFTSAKIRNGSTYLADHLSANDYYAQGERVTGEWLGKGAESLALSGEVRPEAFEALRVNLRPGTGERLTPRTKETRQPTLAEAAQAFRVKEGRFGNAQEVANYRLSMKPVSNRVAFFDFQCSTQKSVSILAVLGGDERLKIAHKKASRIALSELERFASPQRNTPLQRRSELTGNICAAAFTHDASRALDPQLPTHFVIANATCDRTGKWYALNEYEMVEPSATRAKSTRTRWRAPFSSWAMVSGWCDKMAKSLALRSREYPIRSVSAFPNAARKSSAKSRDSKKNRDENPR